MARSPIATGQVVVVEGKPGPQGSPGTPEFNSVAAFEAATISPTYLHIHLTGYASPGDGGAANYTRVVSEPIHLAKVRSADRFLPNGSVSSANGGWWEFAVGQIIAPEQFGALGNGVADDRPAWLKATSALNAFGGVFRCYNETYIFDMKTVWLQQGAAWTPNTLIAVNTLIADQGDGLTYRCLVAHTTTNAIGPNWTHSTVYSVGDIVADAAYGGYYECLVGHTSPASGYFRDDMRANPTRWRSVFAKERANNPGRWSANVAFNFGDILTPIVGRSGFAIEGNGATVIVDTVFPLGANGEFFKFKGCSNFAVRDLTMQQGLTVQQNILLPPEHPWGGSFYGVLHGIKWLCCLEGCTHWRFDNNRCFGGNVAFYTYRNSFGAGRAPYSHISKYWIIDGLYCEDVAYAIDTSSSGWYGKARNVSATRQARAWFGQNVCFVEADFLSNDHGVQDVYLSSQGIAWGQTSDIPILEGIRVKYKAEGARSRIGNSAIYLIACAYDEASATAAPVTIKNIDYDIDIDSPFLNPCSPAFAFDKLKTTGTSGTDYDTTGRGCIFDGIRVNRLRYRQFAVASGEHIRWLTNGGTTHMAAGETVIGCVLQNIFAEAAGIEMSVDCGGYAPLVLRNIDVPFLNVYNRGSGKLREENIVTGSYRTHLNAGSGYQRMPDGTILQWGNATGNNQAITFPIPFPNACTSVQITPWATCPDNWMLGAHASPISFSGFTGFIRQNNAGTNAVGSYNWTWMAVGY